MSAEGSFLVLGLDGTVISSGGDLQGDDRCAATIFQLVKTASQGDLKAQRITVNYADHAYVICASEKKIHVVKKSTAVPEVVA
jgi:hypothetical protein